MTTPAEKAWYVPDDAIWDDPYWRLPVLESEPTQ
jgi:hypothetical protein